jgi:hypothetical protein
MCRLLLQYVPQGVNLDFQARKCYGHELQFSLPAHVLNRARNCHGLFRVEVRRQAAQAVSGASNIFGVTFDQSRPNCPQKFRGIFDEVNGKLSKELFVPTKAL